MQKITVEDSAIIARYQNGDKDAFNELVLAHRQRVFHYAVQLTKNAEEANDIVDDAFIRVFKSLMSFRGDSSFSTWLYRIVTNCFLDQRKKQHYRREVSLEDLLRPDGEQFGVNVTVDRMDPYDHMEGKERITIIDSALKQLPHSTRTILMMYHADSMSYDEIAGSLQLPIGTVKSRLNRARLRLRQALQPWRGLLTA